MKNAFLETTYKNVKSNTNFGLLYSFSFWLLVFVGLGECFWSLTPNYVVSQYFFAGKLELEFNLDVDGSTAVPQTPAPCSARPNRSRRRVRREEVSSDEENSPPCVKSVVPSNGGTIGPRSQRASKTAAMTKITRSKAVRIEEEGFHEDDDEDSEVTAEDSDESDELTE